MARLGAALGGLHSEQELLQLTAELVVDLSRANACLAFLREEEGGAVCRASAADAVGKQIELEEKTRARLARAVLEEGGLLRFPALVARLCRPAAARLTEAGVRDGLGLPLKLGEEVRGALLVLSRDERPFSPGEVGLLESLSRQAAAGLERLRLCEQAQRRLLELSDLAWVSTQVNATLELPAILSTIAAATARALSAPLAGVALRSEEGDLYIPPWAHRGLPAGFPKSFHPGEKEGLAGLALASAEPQMVSDARAEGRLGDPLLRGVRARALLCAPLMAQEKPLGILFALYRKPRRFSRHEVNLLSTYASQAALAMNNSLLYQDLVRHLDQLSTVFEVSQTLTSSLDLKETLDRLLRAAAGLLKAPICNIMLLDPESGELTIKAAHGLKVEHIVQSRLAPGEGLAGLAAKEGVVMYSREVLKDGRFRLREIAREEGLRSALSVPLLAQERVIGVLNLYTDAPRQFTDSEHRLISTLANSAAIAIENARLYEETRERAQFLFALMGEINRRVRSNLQSVAALLQLELADPATSKEQALRNCIGRLHSIAAVHELLQAENVELVDVKEIARRILDLGRQNFLPRGAEIRLGVSGTHLLLPSQQATSLAIAVHELVDNAFAHGFPDREKGRISICLSVVKERAILQVQDDGVGLPSGFSLAKTGLGLRIVRGLVEDELGGEFSLSSGERGTIARMQIPT